MKKLFLPVSIVMLILSIVVTSCEKKGAADPTVTGPAITYITDGFLCNMGISYNSVFDTLRYWSATAGQTVQGYMDGSGTLKDEVSFVNNSNGSILIKLKEPLSSGGRSYHYFRDQPNTAPSASTFPEHAHLFNWSEAKSSETEFVIKRKDSDKTKFTIECKNAPGYFLGTQKSKNSVQTIEGCMVFTSRQQEFFSWLNKRCSKASHFSDMYFIQRFNGRYKVG